MEKVKTESFSLNWYG